MSSDSDSQYSFEEAAYYNYRFNPDNMFHDDRGPLVRPHVKWEVWLLDPNEGRCLITNASLESGVTFIHCLPPRLRENLKWKGRMEWYWGLRWNELDFESPRNVFTVSHSLGGIFDFPKMKPSWILLPEDHIVDKFYNSLMKHDKEKKPREREDNITTFVASRGSIPVLEETSFKYRLVPLPQRMQSMLLTRHTNPNPNTNPDLSASPNPSDFSVHLHPFNALPWVTSHLDPKFVIMDAGRKLMLIPFYLMFKQEWFTSRPALLKVLHIFKAWRAPIPSVAFSGQYPDYYTPDMGYFPATAHNITHTRGQAPCLSNTLKREKEAIKSVNHQSHYNSNTKPLSPREEKGKWTAAEVATWSRDVSVQVKPPARHILSLASGWDNGGLDMGQPTQDIDVDVETDVPYNS